MADVWRTYPTDAEAGLVHVVPIVRTVPYLLFARSSYLVVPNDSRHDQLRFAWKMALPIFQDNPSVLRNASDFYLRWSAEEAARVTFAALHLAPDDALVHQCVGEYFFQGSDLGWGDCTYELAVEHLERARRLSPVPRFVVYIGQTAMAALEAGHDAKAIDLANETLRPSASQGDESPHLGHSVLGRLALRSGDSASAVEHLDASTKGSWWTWGPSLRLARELALAGHIEPVRRFLTAVRDWPGRRPAGIAERWLEAFEAGRYDELKNPGR